MAPYSWLLHNQIPLRLICFIIFFSFFVLWENKAQWRPWLCARPTRWMQHIGLASIGALCLKLFFPTLIVGLAIPVEENGIGLLNQVAIAYPLKVFIGVICMDFTLYIEHRAFHRFSWLWPFHRIHHMDQQLDVSTGVRFHPIEILFSAGFKLLGIGFFGVPVLAVAIFEILLLFFLFYAHSNIVLKNSTEKYLRYFIITPSMHRIHHSDRSHEHNSNYGFCLSLWDRFFGSYTAVAHAGEKRLVFGLEHYGKPSLQRLENLLLLPFNPKHLRIRPPEKIPTKKKSFLY